MTQEEKDLLLKDLCARLPHEVIIQYKDFKPIKMYSINEFTFNGTYSLELAKPYLRPMSSMTKEEKSYYEDRWFEGYHVKHGDDMVSEPEIPSYIDWLLFHHFDYRGLIEKGLAISVTEDNNPYKN